MGCNVSSFAAVGSGIVSEGSGIVSEGSGVVSEGSGEGVIVFGSVVVVPGI